MSQLDFGFNLQEAPQGASWRRVKTGWFCHYELMLDGKPTNTWVHHCGHPTALRPYYVHLSTGRVLARKYRLLVDAKRAAEEAHGDAEAV